jgi:hypothetical protein
LEEKELVFPMENPRSKMYSFEKLTQFSEGNNALDAAASNIDGFLCGDTCLSSMQLSSPIWNSLSLFPP